MNFICFQSDTNQKHIYFIFLHYSNIFTIYNLSKNKRLACELFHIQMLDIIIQICNEQQITEARQHLMIIAIFATSKLNKTCKNYCDSIKRTFTIFVINTAI